MTIHVNIGDLKAEISELIAAAERGETVVFQREGTPVARIVLEKEKTDLERRTRIAAERVAAIGSFKAEFEGFDPDAALAPSMTDKELEERFERKFGASL